MEERKKHTPERTCAVCRKKAPKNQFLKVVRTDNGIVIDSQQKINGRGMYICKTSSCIEKAIKTRALNRAFKKEVPETIYKELRFLEELNQN